MPAGWIVGVRLTRKHRRLTSTSTSTSIFSLAASGQTAGSRRTACSPKLPACPQLHETRLHDYCGKPQRTHVVGTWAHVRVMRCVSKALPGQPPEPPTGAHGPILRPLVGRLPNTFAPAPAPAPVLPSFSPSPSGHCEPPSCPPPPHRPITYRPALLASLMRLAASRPHGRGDDPGDGPTALFSLRQFCPSASSNLCVRRNLALPLEPHEPLNEQRLASLRLEL